ncbi:MAG: molybdenum cofactor biosynthesis protein MoaE [Chloroflexi bacterium]|nr:molybdenum cofactor biosynthesis protein MoaE [Chloroflexota bacterium]
MIVELTSDPIDVPRLIDHVNKPSNGGICTFLGVVRDNAEGRPVVKLGYEAYESMAVVQMRAIVEEAIQRWDLDAVALSHRTGELEIGEASVAIAVGAPHRAEAFEACRYIIDTLKTRVPIWKKEFFQDGAVWVEPVSSQSSAG